MKLTVDSAALRDAVVWAARYLAPKPDRPALTGLLLHTGIAGKLTIVGADGDTWATAEVTAEVWDDGTAVLPGKLLADIAGKLPTAPVEISLDGAEATIACGALTLTVPTVDAEDYPTVPALPQLLGTVGAGAFATAITQVAVAAGKDPKVPMSMGLQLATTEAGLQLSAADGFQLARATVALKTSPDRAVGAQALVPAATLVDLARGLSGAIALHIDPEGPRSVGFAWEGRQITTPVLEVTPIPYDRALRRHLVGQTIDLGLDRATFLEALGRIAVVFEGGAAMPRLHLVLAGDTMTLQVRSGSSTRGRAAETIAVTYDGPDRELQANAHYLAEALKAGRGETLRAELTEQNSMLLHSPLDENWVHLLVLLLDPKPAEAAA